MAQLVNLSNRDMDSEYNLDGYEALDGSDNKLGKIDGVIADDQQMQPRYLVVDTGGWFSSKKFVVPVGEVSRIDDDEHHVYFKSLTKDMLQGGSYPQYDESWWNNNDHTSWNTHEQNIANSYSRDHGHDHDHMREDKVDYNSDLYRRPTEGAQRLQLMEERLRANKERYQAGEVKLGKRITQRTETMQVPVTEERVVIERRPATGQATGAEVGKDQTIEVPVMRERVNAEKETVVKEEVGVRKEAVQRTEQVQGTVRNEELEVKDGQELMTEGHRAGATDAGYRPDSPRPADEAARRAAEQRRNS